MKKPYFLLSKKFRNQVLLAILLTLVFMWAAMMYLSVYTHRGERIATPDFSGKRVDEVIRMAEESKLEVTIKDSVYQAGIEAGRVVAQFPRAGQEVKSGRMVSLTLASAVPDRTTVPKLTDISLRQARVLLESKGFMLGEVSYVESEFNDLVLEQRHKGLAVAPGTKIENGEAIDLVVGRARDYAETVVPDFSGLTFEEAIALLRQQRLSQGIITFDASVQSSEDSVAARVIVQSLPADTSIVVPTWTPIDLTLSIEEPVNQ